MSRTENGQKVRIEIKEEFSFSLLRPYLKADKNIIWDDHNQALIKLLTMQGGQTVIAHVTEDGKLAVNGEAYGLDGHIMLGWEFINLENIEPLGINFFKGKLYRMVDQDGALGFFIGVEFDAEAKAMLYSIMHTEKGLIKGKIMAELEDETLEMFGLGDRFDYYTDGVK